MPLPAPFKYKYVMDYGNHLGTGKYTISDAEGDFAKSQLPGARIKRSLNEVTRKGDKPRQSIELLFMVFTEQSRRFDWGWLPATACRSAKLLDGEITGAECAAFATGMYCLARAPHPFGLGVSDGDGTGNSVKIETYTGEKLAGAGPGFVSFHPSNGVLGLLPNVHTQVGAMLPGRFRNRSFYMWKDHKVVRYENHLFDPTYGCQYEALPDMACLQIVDWEVLGGAKPATLDQFDDQGPGDAEGRHLYICKDSASDARYYIRISPSALQASEKTYQGPYTQSQRDQLAKALSSGASKSPITAATVFGYA